MLVSDCVLRWVSEEFLSAVYGRVYDFGPSDVGNLDVKMIGTFLTLW